MPDACKYLSPAVAGKESIEGRSDSLLRENFINGKDIPEIAVLPFINVYFAINVQFLYIYGYLTVVM